MASLVSLKTRLSSVTSTQKVIKAMELVAASKIKKAREKARAVKFFHETVIESMNNLDRYIPYNEIIEKNINGSDLFLVITSDMGLCGSYNINILKKFFQEYKKVDDAKIIVIGNKGIKKMEYENINIYKKYTGLNNKEEINIAKDLTNIIWEEMNNHNLRSIKIVYTDFLNPIKQEVKVIDLLDANHWHENKETKLQPLEIEPDANIVFEELFKQYILALVYTSLLKSFASEHSYRRNSMDSANTNSLELIDKLKLELNRIRQGIITQEITEIIGGSESSKKE